MSPLAQYIALFIAISAVTAVVNSMISERRPRKIILGSLHFLVLILMGIAAFSAVVYGLECLFIRRPW